MSELNTVSILIPIYNYNVSSLVKSLSQQGQLLPIKFEILCYDDESSDKELRKKNSAIKEFPGVKYLELEKNIGRSKIRNKLAQDASYDYLLFIDCDSSITGNDYLKNYINSIKSSSVSFGGTVYSNIDNPEYSLRLKYGKAREQKDASFRMKHPYHYTNLNNLFIKKEIYQAIKLDENIRSYGHEDTKFGYCLKEKKIPVLHINNPVEHCGLETNEIFIRKTKEGIKNFYLIIKEGFGREGKLYKAYSFIDKYNLRGLFNLYYSIIQKSIEKNLLSSNPSLFYFDLMKLKTLLDQENSRQ